MGVEQADQGHVVVLCDSATIRRLLRRAILEQRMRCHAVRNRRQALRSLQDGIVPSCFVVLGGDALKEGLSLALRYIDVPVMVLKSGQDGAPDTQEYPPNMRLITDSAGLRAVADTIMSAQIPARRFSVEQAETSTASELRHAHELKELNKAHAFFRQVVQLVEKDQLPGPMVPGLITEVRAMLNAPDVSLFAISEFVKRHQALSLKLLNIANSPYYHRGNRVDVIEQAISRLGLDATSSALQAIAALEYLVGAVGDIRELLVRELRLSFATAIIGERMATFELHPQPDRVYSAGLLSNIGTTFFLYTFALLRQQAAVGVIDVEAIASIAEAKAAELAALIRQALNLPPELDELFHVPKDFERASTVSLVLRAGWVAERVLYEEEVQLERCSESDLLSISPIVLKQIQEILPTLKESLAAYGD